MKYIFLAVLCALLFVGCHSFTEITYKTIAVTENPIGEKIGQIERSQGGILEAAKNGGIIKISTVSLQNTDKYTTHYWPLLFGADPYTTNTFHKEEVIVTGE